MDILYKKLQQIKQKPALYIGKKSLPLLRAFLDGYIEYHNETNEPNEPNNFFISEFNEYLQRRFNVSRSHGWVEIIIFFSINEDAAFDAFFLLLDDFFSETQQ
ncbi:hypothetical protein [Cohnella sp. GCM10027633]|uniref:hypothetical protein n=1 Tax=unclassified Cohnella TaxID=2636738 RepID=UPI00363DF886